MHTASRAIVALLFSVGITASQTIRSDPASGATSRAMSVERCAGVASALVHVIGQARDAYSVEPPSSFDPMRASDAELACYGFPARPAEGPALAKWQVAMQYAQHYITPVLGEDNSPIPPTTGSVCSGCYYSTWRAGTNFD